MISFLPIKDFKQVVVENIVLFSSSEKLLSRLPVPTFLESVLSQCQNKWSDTYEGNPAGQGVGKMLIINLTIDNIPKPINMEELPDKLLVEDKIKDFKPNILLTGIKRLLTDQVTTETLTHVMERIHSAVCKALVDGYDSRKNATMGICFPAHNFGFKTDKLKSILEEIFKSNKFNIKVGVGDIDEDI